MMSKPIKFQKIWKHLHSCKGFFYVKFIRKTSRPDGSALKGDIREMVARLRVHKHCMGVLAPGVRAAEDERCRVLTCWDIGVYQELRGKGISPLMAGKHSYRRINMRQVLEVRPIA